MADIFTLLGSYSVTPASGTPSGDPSILAPLNETLTLKSKQYREYTLSADSVQAVDFGGVANAHLIIIVSSAKVRVRFTSTDGATQSVPVEGLLILKDLSVPITALDLLRVAGVSTTVKVLLAEKAS